MTRKPPARLSRPPTPPGSPAPAHGDGPTGPNAPTGHTGPHCPGCHNCKTRPCNGGCQDLPPFWGIAFHGCVDEEACGAAYLALRKERDHA